MSQALHLLLNTAIKAARSAGAVINRASPDLDLLKVNTKSPNDFVTETDPKTEAVIIETLLGTYPVHGILAEESSSSRSTQDSEYVWIVDPLDGTTNFIHDIEFRKGDNFKRYLQMLEVMMPACAVLRRPGPAARDLRYMAAGYADDFFETGPSPWDIAAGPLMITEAGGLIGNFTGESDYLYQREVLAASPKAYGQFVKSRSPFTPIAAADDRDRLPVLTPEAALATHGAVESTRRAPVRIRKDAA